MKKRQIKDRKRKLREAGWEILATDNFVTKIESFKIFDGREVLRVLPKRELCFGLPSCLLFEKTPTGTYNIWDPSSMAYLAKEEVNPLHGFNYYYK